MKLIPLIKNIKFGQNILDYIFTLVSKKEEGADRISRK